MSIVKNRHPLKISPPTPKRGQRTFGQRAAQPPGLRPLPPIMVIPHRTLNGPGPGWASRTLASLAQGFRPKHLKTK